VRRGSSPHIPYFVSRHASTYSTDTSAVVTVYDNAYTEKENIIKENNIRDPEFMRNKTNPILGQLRSSQINIQALDPEFIEWFVGFVDAEGLFAVYLRESGLPKLSFRITLHIDDLAA